MLPSSENRIKEILDDVMRSSPYIKAVAMARISGVTMVSVMPTYVSPEHVSAMSAVMVLLGERIARAMRSGELNQVYIKGDEGHIVMTAVGNEAVLMITAQEHAPLGLLFIEMGRAAKKLRKLV